MLETLQLALICLRIGTFVFGGGLVMIPLLQTEIVDHHQWLTQQEFLDAVALGQMTPGPLLVTATFIGYKVSGLFGAIVATISIFLPSFVMTLAVSNSLKRLQGNRHVTAFLWGVKATVVGLILAAGVSLVDVYVKDLRGGIIALAALGLLLLWKKADPAVIVLVCGVLGLLFIR